MIITICICGAGTMGNGIAQIVAQAGYKTILYDIETAALESARAQIFTNLEYLLKKEKINEAQRDEIMERIKFTNNLRDCFAQVIIEAIVEKEAAKIELFQALAEFNNEDTIFASNTSSISISAIQQPISFPERVVGMHFFNPPYIMKLVEVVKGKIFNEEIIRAVMAVCEKLGKKAVLCTDFPGFIVNRVARHYYLESLKMAEEGIASFEDIDRILEETGFKMGPFRLMDLIGMDVNLAVSERMYEAFDKADRFLPSQIQKEKVQKGELGKKTGKGFYTYS